MLSRQKAKQVARNMLHYLECFGIIEEGIFQCGYNGIIKVYIAYQ